MSLISHDVQEGDELPRLFVDVSATTIIMGASASRDWRPMHHDRDFAVNRARTEDIFLNTPTQAGWIEKYVTDWAGSKARLAALQFQMKTPVFPGDSLAFSSEVTGVWPAPSDCSWVGLELSIEKDSRGQDSDDWTLATVATVLLSVPNSDEANPWAISNDDWDPRSAYSQTVHPEHD